LYAHGIERRYLLTAQNALTGYRPRVAGVTPQDHLGICEARRADRRCWRENDEDVDP